MYSVQNWIGIGATALLAGALTFATTAGFAMPRYDGLWSVSIVAAYGDCSRGYRYPPRIQEGYVLKAAADPSYAIAGEVARNGAIGVTGSFGGKTANGVGRRMRNIGRGVWHTTKGECSGQRTADRRG